MSLPQGIVARNVAMAQGEANANPDYKEMLLQTIQAVARQKKHFCSDDIADVMQYADVQTHDKRVLGAMMKKAQLRGWCRPLVCQYCHSHITRRTKNKKSHASPMNYWESLIYSPVENAIGAR